MFSVNAQRTPLAPVAVLAVQLLASVVASRATSLVNVQAGANRLAIKSATSVVKQGISLATVLNRAVPVPRAASEVVVVASRRVDMVEEAAALVVSNATRVGDSDI